MTKAELEFQHSESLKVLQVIQPTTGGAALNVLQLAEGLNSDSLQISVVSPPDGFLRNKLTTLKIRHISLDFTRQIKPLHDLRNLISLWKIIKNEDFNIVHAHSSKAGFLSRIATCIIRTPCVVYTPHGFAFYQAHSISRLMYKLLEQFGSLLTDKIICVSPSEREFALQDRVASDDKLIVIENGINVDDFHSRKKGRLRETIGIDPSTRIIGMVSRLSRPKQPEDIIEAVDHLINHRHFTDIACVFIGSGPLETSLKRNVNQKELDQYFHFLGYRNDVEDLLPDLDIFVLATASEGLPYTILEAMATSLPVVASKVKGVVDLVKEDLTGFMYAPGDYLELARLLTILIENKTLRKQLGQNGKMRVKEHLSLENMVSKTKDLYSSLSASQANS